MVRLRIGAVEVETDQALDPRELKALIKYVAGIAVALKDETPEEDAEEEPRPTVSLGFTTEIAPPVEIDLSEYFEEEERAGEKN
jgi:hypothetical protein